MSFSEYNGSKAKVSQAVGRILRNAQGNLPKLPSSQVSAMLTTISNSSKRLSKPTSQQPNKPKFPFHKVLPGLLDKRKTNKAELLDNQEAEEDSDEGEGPVSHAALIGPPTSKQRRWPF